MFGIALAALSNVFEEISDSIGKRQVQKHVASVYTFGFLGLFFGAIILGTEGILRHSLHFSLNSLPTFIPRLALEILQAYVTVRAITLADRGDFGFMKTLTIPLLLGMDIAFGYAITAAQVVGMVLIVLSVLILLIVEHARIQGLWYLVVGTVNAAVTITLYKYDIVHFNSVEAEQTIMSLVLMAYFFACAQYFAGENPLRFLKRGIFLEQSASSGLSNAIGSFAYAYAPASVILAALRSSAVLFALVSGRFYFRESHFLLRTFLLLFIIVGLALLVVH